MEALKQIFADKRKEVRPPSTADAERNLWLSFFLQGVPAFVTFVTAGFPTVADTVPILLGMQEGGADVIELGMPFSDPIADGPAIQDSNTVSSRLHV